MWEERTRSDHEAAPLDGVRILDLSRLLSGPYATYILGNLGADIIKVERPTGGDDTRTIPPKRNGESHYFLSVNTNKRSIVVDLKQERGRQIARDLAKQADVVLENFRPGVADRLGLGFEDLLATNDRLIYCSVSAFGQDGPWAERGAFDLVVQALSGVMSVTGQPDGPPARLGLPMGDLSAGIFAAIGILGALVERERTGVGQHIDVAMLDSTISLLGYLAGWSFMTGDRPPRVGNSHHSLVPYGVYEASDGFVTIAVFTESFWPKLCQALELPELATDDRFSINEKRLALRGEVDEIVSRAVRKWSVEEVVDRLAANDVPHAPVLDVTQALDLEQVKARGIVQSVTHDNAGPVSVIGSAIRQVGKERLAVRPAPSLGSDTDRILADVLGYSADEIQGLRDQRVVDFKKPS